MELDVEDVGVIGLNEETEDAELEEIVFLELTMDDMFHEYLPDEGYIPLQMEDD